jgi:hypothetical protein
MNEQPMKLPPEQWRSLASRMKVPVFDDSVRQSIQLDVPLDVNGVIYPPGLYESASNVSTDHLKRVEEVARDNAKLANETPLTKEQAEELSRRAT